MKHLLLLIYCFLLPLSLLSQLPDTNYDEALVPKYDLPDLFEFNNGEKVTDRNEWLLRKKEIIGHFENEVYGISPEWDGTIESFVISETDTLFDGLAKRQEILIRLKNNNKTVDIFLLLYLPRNICKAPIFLGYNFHGNHTVTFEEEIRITKNWVRNNNSADAVNNKASEKGRGAFSNRWPIKEIISRGFGVATLYYGDIDPDYDDGFKNGIHALYDARRDDTSWGSIAAWSWGLSRVMDYLETKDNIDRDRIFLIGHSRLGKAALWAAACDERFAMVISNNSGCGGAALSRRQFGETVEIINNSFPHWFNGNFKKYNGKENLLPVDQHALIALMAPRPVYIASASEDLWADPKGEFLAGLHASPVYTLFDKDGIEDSSMPSVNTPIQQGSIAYHLRDGKHDITLYDWQEYMNYIDFHFCCCNSKDPDKSMEERLNNIISLLSIEEKADFLTGVDMWHFKGNERLGIPSIQVTDCGHGVTVILNKNGIETGSATCFPTAVGQAATWDPDLIREVGAALGRETRATGSAMLLAPMVNIKRTPLNGRNYEVFSEDPLLSGELAASFVQGVQSEQIGAVIKAFTANNQQANQENLVALMDERTLQEIYLPSFKIAIDKADPWGLMTAYNGLNDSHTSENKHLLCQILKNDWAYKGFVVSDWRGVKSTEAIISGLDIEMPGPGKFLTKENVLKAIENESLTVNELDNKVKRILRAYIKTGLLDDKIPIFNSELNSERHKLLARKVAEEGIVLLKNKNNTLPIKKTVKKIAVIGPNANEARLGGGGSASVTPFYSVSPLEGLKNFKGEEIEITYHEGCGLNGNLSIVENKYLINSENGQTKSGLKAEYFSNRDLKGVPDLVSTDPGINFSWGWMKPRPEINTGNYSVRWTGQLLPPKEGNYNIGISGASCGFRLYLDGELLIDEWEMGTKDNFEAALSAKNRSVGLSLKKDIPVDIKVEFRKNSNRNFIRFEWEIPGNNSLEQAIKAAEESDVAIIFAGLSNFFEGGANDRKDIHLPGDQNELIARIAKVNASTVVVLINGAPVSMPWVNEVNAIIEAYYPGQEGGNAIANVLFGKVNPSGKLPETFPLKLSDNPAYEYYPGNNDKVNYTEGIFVGYRHYDSRNIEPLFPFGHGLSYTTFEYSNLEVKKSASSTVASFEIKNSGNMDGMEVAQLYIRDVEASEFRPLKELKDFKKIFLKAGEKKEISFEITDDDLSFFSSKLNKWIAESGEFEILIGSSSRDIRIQKLFYFNN